MNVEVGREKPGLPPESVAEVTGGAWDGVPELPITGVAPLKEAGPTELGFLADQRYLDELEGSRAGAILVARNLAERGVEDSRPHLVVAEPHRALRALLHALQPEEVPPPHIHPTAVLGSGVELGVGVSLGPYVVLEDGVRVGDHCRIGAHAVIGRDARVGDGSVIHPHAVIYPRVEIGKRVILHSGVRVGVDGFGYVFQDGAHEKIPQVGPCRIEDDVEIGANACVDRGSIGTTSIGAGTKLDNLVHVGHNVQVGRGSLLVAQVGIGGSSRIEDGAVLGGQAGIAGHVTIGKGARVAGQAGVIGDLPPEATVSGYPARDHREYLRGMANVFRLPEMTRRLRELERRVQELEGEEDDPGGSRQEGKG